MTSHLRAVRSLLRRSSLLFLLAAVLTSATGSVALAQQRARLTYQDLMQIRQIQNPSISADGRWVALAATPDRGDGEVLVHSADGGVQYAVPQGAAPVISADGRWVAMRLEPSFEARETAARGVTPRPGMALLDTRSGEVMEWERVQRFAFSSDGKWLARHLLAPERAQGGQGAGAGAGGQRGGTAGASGAEAPSVPQAQETEAEQPRTRDNPGTILVLRELATGTDLEVEHVRSFLFHDDGAWLAYVVASGDGEGDGVSPSGPGSRRHVPSPGRASLRPGRVSCPGGVGVSAWPGSWRTRTRGRNAGARYPGLLGREPGCDGAVTGRPSGGMDPPGLQPSPVEPGR
jgi:hypothetical protein